MHPRSLLTLTLTFALAGSLVGCADDEAPEDAAALLERLRAEDYRSWARAPGYEMRRDAESPHADQVDVYVNDVVEAALAGGPIAAWPVGSVIVKDGFDGDALELIAVMEKRADGWFWAEYFDDVSKYSGTPEVCTGCHEGGDDFVMAFDFPR
jgi:hypothetical protein